MRVIVEAQHKKLQLHIRWSGTVTDLLIVLGASGMTAVMGKLLHAWVTHHF